MTCELRPGMAKPIDALIRYFLEVKPYHTKLLEVVEKYRINEYISVGMTENYNFDIVKKNLALCGPVGFGLVWDEECGFDAVECCDLFECIGGYGLIFDNSDLLVTAPIISIDESADTVELAGEYTASDFTYDQRIQIQNITSSDTIVLRGNYESVFNTHKLFLVVPFFTFDIVANTANSFFVAGNKVSEIKSKMDFRVSGSRYNNGVYGVTIVRYIPATNRTEIVVSETVDTTIVSGYMEVRSPNKNNGVYQVKSVIYNGSDTIITIRNNNVFNHVAERVHGSIQLRTGLIAPRRVWHYNPDTLEVTEFKISNHSYNPVSDTTTLTFAESFTAPVSGNGEIRLYGYRFGAGFDGFEECTVPKPYNIHMNFGEVLNITVNTIPPSPTPTISVTPTVTPTISVTPSTSVILPMVLMEDDSPILMEDGSPILMEDVVTPTPTVTPTITPTVTPSITSTVTPTVTPTITPTPSTVPSPMLMEGGSPILMEDGSPILME